MIAVTILVALTIAVTLWVRTYLARARFAAAVGFALGLDLCGMNLQPAAPFCDVLLVVLAFVAWLVTRNAIASWRKDARDALPLAAPFEGKWAVVAGGPAQGRNHHLVRAISDSRTTSPAPTAARSEARSWHHVTASS